MVRLSYAGRARPRVCFAQWPNRQNPFFALVRPAPLRARLRRRSRAPVLPADAALRSDTLKRFRAENGRSVRAGLEDSAWTELNVSKMADAAFLSFFRGRIDNALDRYNRDVQLGHSGAEFAEAFRPDPEALPSGSSRAVPASLRRGQSPGATLSGAALVPERRSGGRRKTRFRSWGSLCRAREGRLLVFRLTGCTSTKDCHRVPATSSSFRPT